jgi:hypothetical protein
MIISLEFLFQRKGNRADTVNWHNHFRVLPLLIKRRLVFWQLIERRWVINNWFQERGYWEYQLKKAPEYDSRRGL